MPGQAFTSRRETPDDARKNTPELNKKRDRFSKCSPPLVSRVRQIARNSKWSESRLQMNVAQRSSSFLIAFLFLISGVLFMRVAFAGLNIDGWGNVKVLAGATFCSLALMLIYFGCTAAGEKK